MLPRPGRKSLGLSKTSEFTVTVTNTGNSVASDITLTDTLPVGLNFVSSVPAESSASGSEVSWSLGNLEPGGIASITMVLSASAVGEQVNVAIALSTEGITGQGQSVTNVHTGIPHTGQERPGKRFSWMTSSNTRLPSPTTGKAHLPM